MDAIAQRIQNANSFNEAFTIYSSNKGNDPKSNLINSVINKAKSTDDLLFIMNEIKMKRSLFNDNTMRAIITKTKSMQEMSLFLTEMIAANIEISEKTFRAILMKARNDQDILSMLKVIDFQNRRFNKTTYRELLLGLKNFDNVLKVFEEIKQKTLPNVDLYQVAIYKSKTFDDVIPLINEMKETQIQLDDRICSTIINKTQHFSDAILFVYDMIDQEIKVRTKVYETLMKLASDPNQWAELNGLYRKMDVFVNIDDDDVEFLTKFRNKDREMKALEKVNKVEAFPEHNNEVLIPTVRNSISKVDPETLKSRYQALYSDGANESMYFINSDEPLQDHINFLSEEISVRSIHIATGFLYKSGLNLLEPSFNMVLSNDGSVQLLIGSLQKYCQTLKNDSIKISSMDKQTAVFLEDWRALNKAEIKTIEDRFFHGKFYLHEGKQKSCAIIGSSNVSGSGFMVNYEFNLLYIFDTDSSLHTQFKEQFDRIWGNGVHIDHIQSEKFVEMVTEQDDLTVVKALTKMAESQVRSRIEDLTEEQVKKRLRMWVQRNPTSIYSDLGIEALKGYILFEYKEYNLWVFESFDSGNAYYYFRNVELENLLEMIRNLSKTEIFRMSDMQKRGYHINNESILELAISSLFIKRYIIPSAV
ncbi:phospholipase D-like domain-containing protein [Paenibacillus aurantius]|uniref:Phospholipase D-like domain-containing protein n=1 Tax=Paenibacillus aurantius TaxID=2918900 RepID=A0AA96L9T4_9BACL|nr:phospholipase D-like domain-containing protein [Paenibacillus aurantius]WNQ09666.1 phospholipase D-like domain-containing protein [Paenibacillus aurantius]